MHKNKLFLLDAYALIYRSYYAFIRNPRVNSKGENTSAIFGFVNTLEEVLHKENPSHIAVAFDPDGPTFRHQEFEAYKAQREATPEDIKRSVPIIKQIIAAYNIPILEVPGYEADDVIGTIAKRADKDRFDVYMMTPDKDYGQLTESHIFIYKPKYGSNDFDILDDKKVMEKYDLSSPAQMIDLLGLMGDISDNIPGCPGVGEKTAVKLLKEFGTIENLLAQSHQLKGALQKKVEDNREQILFSKFLATIRTDVPIEVKEDNFARKDKNREAMKALFEVLEFRTFLNRLFNQTPAAVVPKGPVQGNLFETVEEETETEIEILPPVELSTGYTNIHTTPHQYMMIRSEEEMVELCKKLTAQPSVCFDTETTGMDPLLSDLVGLSFAFKEGEAYYVPISADREEAYRQTAIFKPFFENEAIDKIGQNLKYDILSLRNYDIHVKGKLFDTMIAHYLLNPEIRHGMDYMAETYLKYRTIHIEELIGPRGKNQKSMRDVDPKIVVDYAAEDADITLKLKNILEREIHDNKLEKLFYDIECPLIYVLADMEWTGVRLDLKALEELSTQYTAELQRIEKEITDMAGIEFNVNSPKQIGEILFDRLMIVDKPKKTKTGQYKTSEEELEKIRSKHPIIEKILEQRGLKKLLGTYIDAFPLLINPRTGKIHTSFNQTVAATGRLSSTNPNLQNIPIRDERGKEMRKVFIPDQGCLFVSSDYSQIELRIMAHLSGDKNMTEAFSKGQDIHAATAARIYKIPLEEVTGDMRRKAKTANFGIIYGITPFGLSERLTISRTEAKELIDGYFATFPQVKQYMDESISHAREKGFVETILGRKRYLADINSRNAIVRGYAERNAINAPIQGSAADIIKMAMIRIFTRLQKEKLQSKMILQVHDELNFNVFPEELEKVKAIVTEEMENACQLSIPLKTDIGVGENWLAAH
ncbi:DNA polymerase I [Proteiniphilum acetatigenes]|uniref:DNA polymerase I n=1 Tax=Proteiniphilum acetatigenes TaxID=294710 RepID=UPI00037C73F1|nr:DNA polymerase I [Proteiniphilum acetatigenes]SFK58692.1 DNA polymerase I [Porphyromonadaceae bacterium KH3CP3RA]